MEEATARYEKSLDQAAGYLVGRGVDHHAAVSHRLGVVSDPIPGHERFVNYLSIPYVTPGGVVAMKFRCLRGCKDCRAAGHGKYDAPAGGSIRLYNTPALLHGGDTVAVCEGEFDALIMHRVVGLPAVGTWGTNWLPHYPRMFADFERVLVIADNDVREDGSNPGVKHAKKIAATIQGAQVIEPPPGLDVSEWVQQYGVDVVRKGLGLC